VDYVVLDTDVASLSFKGQLPGSWARRLLGRVTAVSFVTVGELAQWADLRDWGPRRRAELDRWLSGRAILEYDVQVARTWGRLSAEAVRRRRRRPVNDMWIAACCLVEGLSLATRNVKDYADLVEFNGLRLVTE
jgi:predicted nucleic acid-binding protein